MKPLTMNEIAYRVAKYGRVTRDEPRQEELDAIIAQIRDLTLLTAINHTRTYVCSNCFGSGFGPDGKPCQVSHSYSTPQVASP